MPELCNQFEEMSKLSFQAQHNPPAHDQQTTQTRGERLMKAQCNALLLFKKKNRNLVAFLFAIAS